MPGDKGFRYVYAGNQITKLMDKVHGAGRPDVLNFPYIRDTWLLKNAQYNAVLDLLEDMEFIDSSGAPLPLYAKYQNKSLAKGALTEGIKKAYPNLFKAYPDAQTFPTTELAGYFKQQTGKDDSIIDKMVTTFRTLCSLADFAVPEDATGEPLKEHKETPVEHGRKVKIEPKIQLNIEIHIAADTPEDKIEAIFKNMKTYLLTNE